MVFIIIQLFVIWNTILLINLLVAILMTTYSQLENNKLACFINEILKLRSTMEYDSNCSSLVSTFPPWNGFAMLFVVPILLKKNSQKLNNVLFHVEYIPILVFLFAVYLLFNIVLLPFAYAKGLLVQLQSMKNTKLETSFCVRLLSLIVFAVFGPIVLVLNLAADIVWFFIHSYQSQDVITSKILENLK